MRCVVGGDGGNAFAIDLGPVNNVIVIQHTVLRNLAFDVGYASFFCVHRWRGGSPAGPHGRQRPRSYTKTRERVWVVANLVWWLAPLRLTGLRV